MSEREVVITGIGAVTPVGSNAAKCWDNIKAMKTGIAYYPDERLPKFLQYFAGITDLEVPKDISHKLLGQMKFLNRGAILGFCAAHEAIAPHREGIAQIPPGRRSLYVASGDFTKVGYEFMYPAIKDSADKDWKNVDYKKLNNSALNKVNPFFLLESLSNNLFSFLSAYIEFMGQSTSLANLSPCGGQALELAHRTIRQGKSDVALSVGYGNWITEIPLYELEGLGILSKCVSGIHSYKPFDRNRDGFITGEGGAAILLEAAETARRRGARILGRITGFGNCIELSSQHGISVPKKVTSRSILSAIKEADCLNDLAFIIPHGSGTQKGDRSELLSIMDVLGDRISGIPICGMKPYTGHMGAASDIAEIVFGMSAVRDGIVPATLNFGKSEKEFSGLKISGSQQRCGKRNFLSVSYGVGGHSSSVVVEVNPI